MSSLESETFGGFAPWAQVRVQVIGARTIGAFLLAPGGTSSWAGALALAATLRASARQYGTSFAHILSARPLTAAQVLHLRGLTAAQRSILLQEFAHLGLGAPGSVNGLLHQHSSQWLQVSVAVNTYQPGSLVFLGVTTKPLIYGVAMVGRNGRAVITGAFPLSALGDGAHRLRVVGVRTLHHISAGPHGQIVLPAAEIAAIRLFDLQTNVTVELVGANSHGGTLKLLRIIPLRSQPPWWTLAFPLGATLLALLAIAFGITRRRRFRMLWSVAIVVGAGVPIIVGWVTEWYVVSGWGVVTILGAVVIHFMPVLRRKSEEEQSEPEYDTHPALPDREIEDPFEALTGSLGVGPTRGISHDGGREQEATHSPLPVATVEDTPALPTPVARWMDDGSDLNGNASPPEDAALERLRHRWIQRAKRRNGSTDR